MVASDRKSKSKGYVKRGGLRDFPGGPVVKTLPSNAGGVSLTPGLGAKIPHASGPKTQNIKKRSNIVTNSIKTLKTVHIKKKKNLKKKGGRIDWLLYLGR